MDVNVGKLDQELRAAGVRCHGCDATGKVSFRSDADATDREKAVRVVAAHNPTLTRAQRLAKRGFGLRDAALILVAKKGPLAPEWAQRALNDAAADIEAQG